MFCVIERSEEVVWGVGKTEQEAMADAKNEAAQKLYKVDESIFEIALLGNNANLDACGYELWDHVILTDIDFQPLQQALF